MRGKYKPQRGRARRFTSSHDPDAYVRSRPTRDEEKDSGSDSKDGENGRNVSSNSDNTGSSSSSSERSSDSEPETEILKNEVTKLSLDDRSLAGSKKEAGNVASVAVTGAPRELSRREREAIEKERARQYFLKMKEKEDAARLAIIKKRREEEAARHAAELKAKEEARFTRR